MDQIASGSRPQTRGSFRELSLSIPKTESLRSHADPRTSLLAVHTGS